MARDVSLVISAKDSYSNTIKNMKSATNNFKTDVGGLQQKLDVLNRTKVTLQTDLTRAKNELNDAKRAFSDLADEENRAKLEAAQADYNNLNSQLKLVTNSANEAEKGIANLSDATGKAQNRAGGSGGSAGSVATLAKAGITQLGGQLLSAAVSTFAGSAFGSEAETYLSSGLSSAISGAAMGSMIAPGVGTAVGALVGGVTGLISGAMEVYAKKDETFSGVVQAYYENALEAQAEALSSGSEIAASRETSLISFTTLLGDPDVASRFLADVKDLANTTPFLYDDLTSMAKTLKTFGYTTDELIPLMVTVGDAGAALGMTSSDMTMIATAMGRMKVTDKTTTEYLNLLLERGIPAYDYLASAMGVTKAEVLDMVSKGLIPGSEAAEDIANAMGSAFGGSMEMQSQTFEGLTSTLQGMEDELNNAMGEGYNTVRKEGISEQIDYLSGDSGAKMQDAYTKIGEWKASLENLQEELERDAMTAVTSGTFTSNYLDPEVVSRLSEMHTEYQELQRRYDEGDQTASAEMGGLLAEAQVIAQNEYLASSGYETEKNAQLTLIGNIQADTAINEAYYMSGYDFGEELGKGIAAGTLAQQTRIGTALTTIASGLSGNQATTYAGRSRSNNAWGLDRVPYDNYPALLHEGERVLTASEARSASSSSVINITGNSFTVREEADIDRIAQALAEKIALASLVS